MPLQLTALVVAFFKYAAAAAALLTALAISGTQLGIAVIDPSTLFGVAGPLIVIAIAGFFTIRSNVARIWRENYEAEVVKGEHLAAEIKEQRELKHEALNELAATKLMLANEQAKPDFGVLTEAVRLLALRVDKIAEELRPHDE